MKCNCCPVHNLGGSLVTFAEFDRHFMSLRPATNTRNPWFKEFWEQHFRCNIRHGNGPFRQRCSGKSNFFNAADWRLDERRPPATATSLMTSPQGLLARTMGVQLRRRLFISNAFSANAKPDCIIYAPYCGVRCSLS